MQPTHTKKVPVNTEEVPLPPELNSESSRNKVIFFLTQHILILNSLNLKGWNILPHRDISWLHFANSL